MYRAKYFKLNYTIRLFYVSTSIIEASKVDGQLIDKQFGVQMWTVVSSRQMKQITKSGVDFSVDLLFGSCQYEVQGDISISEGGHHS